MQLGAGSYREEEAVTVSSGGRAFKPMEQPRQRLGIGGGSRAHSRHPENKGREFIEETGADDLGQASQRILNFIRKPREAPQ